MRTVIYNVLKTRFTLVENLLELWLNKKTTAQNGSFKMVEIQIWWVLEDSNLSPPQRQCGALAK